MKNCMKSLLTLSLILGSVACSKSGIQNSPRYVIDTEKPADYYLEHTCDENGAHAKKLVKIEKVERENKRSLSSLNDMLEMAGSRDCSDLTRQELKDLNDIAEIVGGNLRDPRNYDNSGGGLQNYIDDVGVISKFSASEMISPHRPASARACGYNSVLLPPQCRWPSGAVQGLFAGKMREVINDGDAYGDRGITLRNWWRPSCYNSKVGGAGRSDHIQARGFDLDFGSARDRAKAQKWLCDLYKREKPLNIQVGIGCQTIHIGIGSPKNMTGAYGPDYSRFWTYGSLQSCGLKRLDGDDCWLIKGGQKRIYTDQSGYRGGL